MRPTTEFRELMEEPPGGHNAGRVAPIDPATDGRWLPLDTSGAQATGFVRNGGWTIVDTRHRPDEGGMTSHRGVLHEDEYVDEAALMRAVEDELGFSREDVRGAYRQGRLSTDRAELRAQIDARLLGLSRQGANMVALGRVLGLRIREDRRRPGDDDCPVIDAALARAKTAELSTEGSL